MDIASIVVTLLGVVLLGVAMFMAADGGGLSVGLYWDSTSAIIVLGGSLAAIAIIVKHEIVLAIIGGLFVLETVSVIIQVISFKLTGKRIFKMAPIHHLSLIHISEPTRPY